MVARHMNGQQLSYSHVTLFLPARHSLRTYYESPEEEPTFPKSDQAGSLHLLVLEPKVAMKGL